MKAILPIIKFIFFIFFLPLLGHTQHFQPVWETPFNPMNIYITQATLNQVDLEAGDEIGVFDINSSNEEFCVGSVQLSEAIEPGDYLLIICSMDDGSNSASPNGFYSGNDFVFRFYDSSVNQEVTQVEYSFPYPGYDEVFTALGTAIANLQGDLQIPLVQTINMKEGWSGISSYLNPEESKVESILYPIFANLTILQNTDQMYWPSQNINTIGDWNSYEGYKIKVVANCNLNINGYEINNTTLPIAANWSLIPVLSGCSVFVDELFEGQDVIIVKEVAGTNLYWPEMNINTLVSLQPGKAYFVLMETAGEITFPECSPAMKGKATNEIGDAVLLNEYNVTPTANSHILAFDGAAMLNFHDFENWEIAAYDTDGKCFGVGILEDNFITLFGDDPTTEMKDGFAENDAIVLNLSNTLTGESFACEVDYDFTYPNYDGVFVTNGLSVISNLKLSPLGANSGNLSGISIFPNPAKDEITIQSNLCEEVHIEIIDQLGNILVKGEFIGKNQKIDVSTLAPGVYLINLRSEQMTKTRKLIIR
jgi:hypothetical protein